MHEKADQTKYKKLTLNMAGLKDFIFDSYGNPITMRNEKVQPTDVEVVKPKYQIAKKTSSTLNQYYASAFAPKPPPPNKNKYSLLPPPVPLSKALQEN